MLAIDVDNTIAAIDAATGKTIAINRTYSPGTMHYLLATIGALVFAAGWSFFAWRATMVWSSVSCCAAALFFCELAAGERLLVSRNYDSEFHHVVAACCAATLLGIVSGTTIIVGWLWAWGNFWQLKRWLLGTLLVIAITLPAAMGLSLWKTDFFASFFSEFSLMGMWVMMMRIALVVTAGNSLVMGLPMLAHFQFAPAHEVGSKQYALSELFAGIAGLAMAMALFRAGVSDSNDSETTWLAGLAGSSIAGGLVSLLLTTIRWPKFVPLVLFVATIFAFLGVVVFFEIPMVPGITRFLHSIWEHVINSIYFATALLAATGSLWLVRRQGWRWTRVAAAATESSTAEASSA